MWCVTFILCVSIVIACVDPLPDPPALKPEQIDAKSDCLSKPVTTIPDSGAEASLASCSVVVRWFIWRQVLEAERSVGRVVLVQHATDPSPPAYPA
jgi:hypothetical protein